MSSWCRKSFSRPLDQYFPVRLTQLKNMSIQPACINTANNNNCMKHLLRLFAFHIKNETLDCRRNENLLSICFHWRLVGGGRWCRWTSSLRRDLCSNAIALNWWSRMEIKWKFSVQTNAFELFTHTFDDGSCREIYEASIGNWARTSPGMLWICSHKPNCLRMMLPIYLKWSQ